MWWRVQQAFLFHGVEKHFLQFLKHKQGCFNIYQATSQIFLFQQILILICLIIN